MGEDCARTPILAWRFSCTLISSARLRFSYFSVIFASYSPVGRGCPHLFSQSRPFRAATPRCFGHSSCAKFFPSLRAWTLLYPLFFFFPPSRFFPLTFRGFFSSHARHDAHLPSPFGRHLINVHALLLSRSFRGNMRRRPLLFSANWPLFFGIFFFPAAALIRSFFPSEARMPSLRDDTFFSSFSEHVAVPTALFLSLVSYSFERDSAVE